MKTSNIAIGVAWPIFAIAALCTACNVVLGIEPAETIETLSGSGGTATGCSSDAACDDANDCTTDRCASGSCENVPADGDLPTQVDADCKVARCVNGNAREEPDAADLPDDDNDCTDDVCNGDMPSHPNRMSGSTCASDGGSMCDGDGNCVECLSNNECTAPQTCGGAGAAGFCGCTPSVDCGGRSCGSLPDDGCGAVLNCNDSMANGTETDVDCGGPTVILNGTCDVRCQTGSACTQNLDCTSGVCSSNACT